MCGIAVILQRDLHRPVDTALLERMTDLMTHRGPDERGTHVDANVGLGHRRLAIIDVRHGQQPMIDTKRSRAIVYNGEIYNFRALRDAHLGAADMHTSSDTEVLLRLATSDSTRWLELLDGMFAFAVWDGNSRTLTLARDGLGIKPLYYVDVGSSVLFASEIKPLLLHPGVARCVDDAKVAEFVAFRSLAGEATLLRGIRQVPAGHMMVLAPPDYRVQLRRYWRKGEAATESGYVGTVASRVAQFEVMLTESIASRLISEVPVGTYNSGGVDSSLVTAMVRSMKADTLHTFSVGFEESSHDERPYAAVVARKCATTHHALVVRQSEYLAAMDEAIWHLEEPINHPHTVQLLLLSRLAKQFVTVVLTGEGADELFGGYPRYNILRVKQALDAVPGLSRRFATLLGERFGRRMERLAVALAASDASAVVDNARFVSTRTLARVLPGASRCATRDELYLRSRPGDDVTNRLLHYDQRTYLPSLLMRLDKTSMAASIEARVPFLDYRLVEWSYGLPPDVKIRRLCNKWIVKQAASRWLPRNIVHRRKFGFDVPLRDWLRDPARLGGRLDLLDDRTFRQRGYFDARATRMLIDEHRRGTHDHTEILWSLLNFEIWCRMFVDAMPAPFRPAQSRDDRPRPFAPTAARAIRWAG